MSNRLAAYRFSGGAPQRTARRSRFVPLLVGLICVLLAIASVTVLQPHVAAPAIIG